MKSNINYFSIRHTHPQKKIIPDLHIPINCYTLGVFGIDKNGAVYSGTTTIADPYHVGKWGDNPYGSIFLQDGDIYTISIVTGTHLSLERGSISFWYAPDRDISEYEGSETGCDYINIPDLLRIRFNEPSSLEAFNYKVGGNSTILLKNISDVLSGTWMFITYTYDCTSGSFLYLNDELVDYRNGTWEPRESMGSLVSIGCYSGTSEQGANGWMDDICFFNRVLTLDDIVIRYYENHDND